jgi:hypothetical protein
VPSDQRIRELRRSEVVGVHGPGVRGCSCAGLVATTRGTLVRRPSVWTAVACRRPYRTARGRRAGGENCAACAKSRAAIGCGICEGVKRPLDVAQQASAFGSAIVGDAQGDRSRGNGTCAASTPRAGAYWLVTAGTSDHLHPLVAYKDFRIGSDHADAILRLGMCTEIDGPPNRRCMICC